MYVITVINFFNLPYKMKGIIELLFIIFSFKSNNFITGEWRY